MTETLRWWLVLDVLGVLLLPLCLALFRRLPDRGYALSKPFGLLTTGWAFWLLNSMRLLPNSGGGIVGALLPLVLLSSWFAWREREGLRAWCREEWRYIAGVEVLFLLVFLAAAWLRAQVGQIQGTEQPMDFMLLNAATRASHFPPADPWLSGHTVAYYYFGYVLVAMTGRLAGVPTDVAYNLGLAMVATMALIGAASIVHNLVRMREDGAPRDVRKPDERRWRNWRPPVFGVAGGLMLVIMGNLVWVFMFASSYGIGGKGLYNWVDVSGLTANEPRQSWYPSQFFGFFNASRIYPLNNQDFRVITEFPMFSFLLGDLHPHVMALPFVLLVVAAALSLYRSPEPLDITFWLQRPLALVAVAMLLGALAFINTWDIATLAFLVVAVAAASNFTRVRRLTFDLGLQVATFAAPLIIVALLLYLPFYTSFTSQANGVGAVVSSTAIPVPATRPFHLLLFWGPLFALVLPFIGMRLMLARERITERMAATAAAPGLLVVLGWLLLYGYQKATDSAKFGPGVGGLGSQIADRGSAWISALILIASLSGALLALWLELTGREAFGAAVPPGGGAAERGGTPAGTTTAVPSDVVTQLEASPRHGGVGAPAGGATIFALGVTATALLLILGTEFFYVGDVFNSRMNTVFKLYYQAWLLLAVGGGFALYEVASGWRPRSVGELRYQLGWRALVAVALAGAALYPLGAGFNRMRPYDPRTGARASGTGELAGIAYFSADDRNAFAWLRTTVNQQDAVIAEAVDGDYKSGARVSMATGIPTILGWLGHEDQWRGGKCVPCQGRFEDVGRLYQTTDVTEMRAILSKYGVTYIYVGNLERDLYGAAGMEKFKTLQVGYASGTVTIYRAKGVTGEVEAAQ